MRNRFIGLFHRAIRTNTGKELVFQILLFRMEIIRNYNGSIKNKLKGWYYRKYLTEVES